MNVQNNYTQTIRGVIVDAITEIPLPGAYVILLNSNPQKGAITNKRVSLDKTILSSNPDQFK